MNNLELAKSLGFNLSMSEKEAAVTTEHSTDEKERIHYLIDKLNNASDKYYNSSESIISDKAWDDFFDELKALEQETGIVFSNSPTQNVGYEVKSQLAKVKHSIPLKSLDKTKEISKLLDFTKEHETVFMCKGDGLTIELIYEDGVLKQASTRGNAVIGDNITHNAKTFENIPLKINFKGYLKLAGEAIIYENVIDKINTTLEKKCNARNLAAGSVRTLDSNTCAKRHVNFLAFTFLECNENNVDKKFKTVSDQFEFLNSLGFDIIPYITLKNTTDPKLIEDKISYLRKLAEDKGLPIDGIVVKYNNIAFGKSLGETLHHPNNAIAFKFYNEEYETEYIKTEWQVSRTGTLTPVANFKSVDLDGAITSKATLHNIDYFKSLQLGKRDRITIARMNEVIPKVLDNLTRSNNEVIPATCPICNSKTEIITLKKAHILICTNKNCPSKKIAEIEHFCSRDAMNIVGLSIATIEKFIDKGFIKEIPDIYKLEKYKNEILQLDGFGSKSYRGLIKAINNSKECSLKSFLYSLGIPSVGRKTSTDLSEHFKSINNFITALNKYDYSLTQIGDIGTVTNGDILSWWGNLNNKKLVAELLKYIKIDVTEKVNTSGIFSNMKIYCTGSFANYKKTELKKIVEDNAGIFANGYAKSLSMLVVGSIKGSSKVDKAEKDGVKIISENEFIEMIEKHKSLPEPSENTTNKSNELNQLTFDF